MFYRIGSDDRLPEEVITELNNKEWGTALWSGQIGEGFAGREIRKFTNKILGDINWL